VTHLSNCHQRVTYRFPKAQVLTRFPLAKLPQAFKQSEAQLSAQSETQLTAQAEAQSVNQHEARSEEQTQAQPSAQTSIQPAELSAHQTPLQPTNDLASPSSGVTLATPVVLPTATPTISSTATTANESGRLSPVTQAGQTETVVNPEDATGVDFQSSQNDQNISNSTTATVPDARPQPGTSGASGSHSASWLQSLPPLLKKDGVLSGLAALGGILLLVGVWLFKRRRKNSSIAASTSRVKPPANAWQIPDVAGESDELSQAKSTGADTSITSQFAAQLDELFEEDEIHDPHKNPFEKNMEFLDTRSPEKITPPSVKSNVPIESSVYDWLNQQLPEQQLSLAFESLVYWMAYADERYEPSFKQKLIDSKHLDNHDAIKRMALQKNTDLFKDSIRWAQQNTSSRQRLQILNLLMALLINEAALTPTQNVLLRFVADCFGIGDHHLNQQYTAAYGSQLPAIPRVDKPLWWQSISDDTLVRWDARALPTLPEETQHRIRLGLPLSGRLQSKMLHIKHQRAAERCNPERYNQLSDRERRLAAKQKALFDQARDALLAHLQYSEQKASLETNT